MIGFPCVIGHVAMLYSIAKAYQITTAKSRAKAKRRMNMGKDTFSVIMLET